MPQKERKKKFNVVAMMFYINQISQPPVFLNISTTGQVGRVIHLKLQKMISSSKNVTVLTLIFHYKPQHILSCYEDVSASIALRLTRLVKRRRIHTSIWKGDVVGGYLSTTLPFLNARRTESNAVPW